MVNCVIVNMIEPEDMSSSSSDSLEDALHVKDNSCTFGGAESASVEDDYKRCGSQGKKKRKDVVEGGDGKVKVPRLLVKDVRKSYPAMIANVLNSGNFSMLYGFLDTFFDRNVQFTRINQSKDGTVNHTLNLNNLIELAKFWYSIMRMSPDSVTRMTEPHIQYTTGNIISNLEVESTFLYETPMGVGYFASYILLDERYGKEILYANDKRTNDFVVGRKYTTISDGNDVVGSCEGVMCPEKLQEMKEIQAAVDGIVDSLPLRENPERVTAKGTFVFSTDENRRITKVEVIIVNHE